MGSIITIRTAPLVGTDDVPDMRPPGGGPSLSLSLGEARKLVAETRRTHGARAARELWFRIGLPVTPAMLEPPPVAARRGAGREG